MGTYSTSKTVCSSGALRTYGSIITIYSSGTQGPTGPAGLGDLQHQRDRLLQRGLEDLRLHHYPTPAGPWGPAGPAGPGTSAPRTVCSSGPWAYGSIITTQRDLEDQRDHGPWGPQHQQDRLLSGALRTYGSIISCGTSGAGRTLRTYGSITSSGPAGPWGHQLHPAGPTAPSLPSTPAGP